MQCDTEIEIDEKEQIAGNENDEVLLKMLFQGYCEAILKMMSE